MISLIICSIDSARFTAVQAMYKAALGDEPWEMIGVHDAKSLAEGYNHGIARARGDILAFSHDDVELLSPEFPQRLKGHLQRFDLIGVAGTSRLGNSRWICAGPPYIFGQVCHQQPDGRLGVDIYGAPCRTISGIQGLDGLFMAARRAVVEKVRFDEATFNGFHLYDLDFSYQAYLAGFRLAVVNDINFLHQSGGKYDAEWVAQAKRFEAKWRSKMPPIPYYQTQWSAAIVQSREHARELMNPVYWNEPSA
jgi:hypothetical protein